MDVKSFNSNLTSKYFVQNCDRTFVSESSPNGVRITNSSVCSQRFWYEKGKLELKSVFYSLNWSLSNCSFSLFLRFEFQHFRHDTSAVRSLFYDTTTIYHGPTTPAHRPIHYFLGNSIRDLIFPTDFQEMLLCDHFSKNVCHNCKSFFVTRSIENLKFFTPLLFIG